MPLKHLYIETAKFMGVLVLLGMPLVLLHLAFTMLLIWIWT